MIIPTSQKKGGPAQPCILAVLLSKQPCRSSLLTMLPSREVCDPGAQPWGWLHGSTAQPNTLGLLLSRGFQFGAGQPQLQQDPLHSYWWPETKLKRPSTIRRHSLRVSSWRKNVLGQSYWKQSTDGSLGCMQLNSSLYLYSLYASASAVLASGLGDKVDWWKSLSSKIVQVWKGSIKCNCDITSRIGFLL